MPQKHTYKIVIYSQIGTCVSYSSEEMRTYTTKKEALKALNLISNREKKHQDLWVPSISKLIVSIEDEMGNEITEKIAFERSK